MPNRLLAIWPKGYQSRSLGKSHQNSNYLNQAMRKSALPARFELAAFRLLVHCSYISQNPTCNETSFPAQVVGQWTVIKKLLTQIPWGDNFFALLVLSSCHDGGYSPGFCAGGL